jgi:ribosomal protein S12 methylthiotransferase accessory factor YcaO
MIAGARDDILHAEGEALRAGEACPLPPRVPMIDWREMETSGVASVSSRAVAERLAAVGYPDACVVRVSAPGDAVHVAKVFVPGLGANLRSRRRAA